MHRESRFNRWSARRDGVLGAISDVSRFWHARTLNGWPMTPLPLQFALVLAARWLVEHQQANPVRLSIRGLDLNAYTEPFVRSAKSECVGQVIPPSEAQIRRVFREYVEHDHFERHHQRLGGLLRYRERAA